MSFKFSLLLLSSSAFYDSITDIAQKLRTLQVRSTQFFCLRRIIGSKPEQASQAQFISVLPLLPWQYWSGELLLIFVVVIIYFSNHFSSVAILSLLSLTSHCID